MSTHGAFEGALDGAFVSPTLVGALVGALEGALDGALVTTRSLTHSTLSFGPAQKRFISVPGLTTPTELVPSAAT